MKKVIILLIFLASGTWVSAQTLTLSLDTVNAHPGDSISIPLTTQNFLNVGSMTLYIQYSPSVLTFSHVTNWNDQLLPGIHLSNHSGNTLAIVWADINGANIPNGKIGDLRFKYLGGTSNLTFTTNSELTDIWGAAVNPPPVFYGGLVKLKLSVTASANPANICFGDSAQLGLSLSGGLGTADYFWTSDPPGFTSSLANPWVYPAVPTSYLIMATDGQDTAQAEIFVDVYDNIAPDPPANLFPANNSQSLSIPVLISWSPALNATAYDFYLWHEGQAEPATPTLSNLTNLNISLSTGLTYGTNYFWRIVSKNPCLSTPGQLMAFSTRHLPDLVVETLNAPATAYSGQNITATIRIKNQGLGSTQSASWSDHVFLSPDTTYENGIDIFLGSVPNLNALNAGESYEQTISFTLPQGISGYYYLIAKTDFYNNVAELTEGNNLGHNPDTFLITLSPIPDLQVTKIILPNSVFSGQALSLSWKVENKGTAATSVTQWYDRVYFSQDTALQPANASILGTIKHTGVLGVDSSYTLQHTFTAPEYILGRYFVYVVTDFYNDVYEHALENNNRLRSDSITVFLTPPPDLEVTSVSVPETASKNEYIQLSYTVTNVGGNPTSGYWYDRYYISSSLTLNTATAIPLDITYISQQLDPEESYTRNVYLKIPESMSGTCYLFVFTDATYRLFEHTFESNNILRSNPLQVLSPDILTDTLILPPGFNSGSSLQIPYTIANAGPGKLLDSWVDLLFISTYENYHPDSVSLCGSCVFNARALDSGQTFDTLMSITLPNGISGSYYVYVVSDYLNSIQEGTAESNNVYRSALPIPLTLSPWPDLQVAEILYSTDTLNAGLNLGLSYTVHNNGSGDALSTPFVESLYLSANPFSPVNLVQFGQVTHTLPIAAGSADTVEVSAMIPVHLTEGFYYVWIKTDATNSVYEHTDEDNNFSRGNPLYILPYPPVDLVCNILAAPLNAGSGQQISVRWKVENQGIAVTQNYWWYDGIYLSTDTVFNAGIDIWVQHFGASGWLPAGQSYIQNQTLMLPQGISGTYYLIAVADDHHWVLDPNFTNNAGLLRDQSGNPLPIEISATPPPDLVVTHMEAPDIIIAGQPFKVKYTIENQGTGNVTPLTWYEHIYVSVNFNASGLLSTLLSRSYGQNLAPGQAYTDSATVYLPAHFQGNYILITQSDYYNQVYEAGSESNNYFTKAIVVQQPPPADLSVVNINASPLVIIGQADNFTVSYKIRNNGLFPATGFMKDLIYLSADTSWDVGDYLAGSIEEHVSIGSGLDLPRTFSGTVSSLAVGDYFVIIRTDVMNNIFESNDTNNTGRTDITLHADVPELPLETLVNAELKDYLPLYYRIEIPALLSGEVLLIRMKADSVYGVNEMYLRYGNSPTRTEFDYAYSTPSYGNQDILVPFLQEGTYYLMVYGSTAQGNIQNIQLYAKKLNFEILSIQENSAGNTGSSTHKLTGSKFTPNMQVFLVKDNTTIEGTLRQFTDQSEVYVTFDLTGADTGVYHVVANKFCDGMAILGNAFHIESGQAANLVVNVLQPAAMATNGVNILQVEFTNAGNTDLIAPDCELLSLKNAPVSLTYQGLQAGLTSLILQMREPGGPPDILRPGMSGTIIVYIKASQALVFTLKLPNY